MSEPPGIFMLSGWRGVGKTTLCQRLAAAARSCGLETAGLVSPARVTGGEKTGFEVEDLRTGRRRLLASRLPDELHGSRLGFWTFDDEVLAWGSQLLRAGVPCDVLIIDELGPLEFDAGRGWVEGFEALESQLYRLAIVVIRPEYADQFMERWPSAIKHHLASHSEADVLAASIENAFRGL